MNSNIPDITGEEEPITIEDDEYSSEPILSRDIVVEIFKLLSAKAYHSLQKDCKINKRYATRMIISNQLLTNRHEQRQQGNDKKLIFLKRRECYLVKLPLDSCCWNDYDSDEIQLYMLMSIQDDKFNNLTWYNVRVHFDHFVSPLTREIFYKDYDSFGQPTNEELQFKKTNFKPDIIVRESPIEVDEDDVIIID